MDRKDEFGKWIATVENAMNGPSVETQDVGNCHCGHWECQRCFPNTEGEESPLSRGDDNLEEDDLDSNLLLGSNEQSQQKDPSEMASEIAYMQQAGLSKSSRNIDPRSFRSPEELKAYYSEVMGDIAEEQELEQEGCTNMAESREFSLFEMLEKDEEVREAFGKPNYKDRMARRSPETVAQKDPANKLGPRPEKSKLARVMGKLAGGRRLIDWMHNMHKLSNEADLTPVPFSERILWKQFKNNPNDFVIVSAENGVAGVRPSYKFIKAREAEYAKEGKTYVPYNDPTVPYHVVAFTDDGTEIHSSAFVKQKEGGSSQLDAEDPTIMRPRMGLVGKKDTQNPINVFQVLDEKIGKVRTVWISGFENAHGEENRGAGSVETDKINSRELAVLCKQALSDINDHKANAAQTGNTEEANSLAQHANKVQGILSSLDKTGQKPVQDAEELRNYLKSLIEQLNSQEGAETNVAEEDEMAAPSPGAAAQTGGSLGSAGGGASSGGMNHYAPGTAPTMPESINHKGKITMENVDKDVAAMLQSLKKYDKLVESVAPVLSKKLKETVEPATVRPLMDRFNSGEISFEEFRNELDSLEHTDTSMRQGEMGMMGNDTPAGHRAWSREQNDYGNYDNESPEEFGDDDMFESGPDKKDIPAWKRKEKGGDWKTSKEDLEKEKDSRMSHSDTLKKGRDAEKVKEEKDNTPPWLKDKKDDKKEDKKDDKKEDKDKVDESADPEVLDWMKRFANLGNMKGYGR